MIPVSEILAKAAAEGYKPLPNVLEQAAATAKPSPAEERLLQAQERQKSRVSRLTEKDGDRAIQQQRFGVNEATPEFDRDMATMSTAQLGVKYGQAAAAQMIAVRAGAQQKFNRVESNDRSFGEIIGDTAIDVTRSFTNLAGGLDTIGATLIDKATGDRTAMAPAFARATKDIDDTLQSWQSKELRERRELNDVFGEVAEEDNQRRRARDAQEEGGFVAGLRQMGRGAVNAIRGSTQDSMVLGSDLINAGASMLAVGPLSKAVAGAGRLGVTAAEKTLEAAVRARALSPLAPAINRATTKKIIDAVSTPIAIGLMEGGSGLQGGINEVMGMTHEQLLEGSEDYRELIASDPNDPELQEAAKKDIAQAVGRSVLAASSVVGALSGRLVRGIEGPGSVVSNVTRVGLRKSVFREGLEEGIQGGTQPLATNLAVQEFADEDRQTAEGVGEGIGEGALLGSLSAGILAAPGSAARNTGKAAATAGKLAFKGTVLGITKARETIAPLLERGAEAAGKSYNDAKARTPMAAASMRNAFDIVKARTADTASTISGAIASIPDKALSPERKQQVVDYTNRMFSRTQVTAEEIEKEGLDPTVKATLEDKPDRLEAINRLTAMASNEQLDSQVRLAAAVEANTMLDENNDTLAEGNQLYDAIEGSEAAAPAASELRRFNEVFTRLNDMPQVQKALGFVSDLAGKIKQSPSLDRGNISRMLGIAKVAPEKIDPAVVGEILEQRESDLTPEEVRSFSVARAVASAEIKNRERAARLGRPGKTPSVVTNEILVDGKGKKTPSVKSQVSEIQDAVRRGRRDRAKAVMGKLTGLAQTLNNKVDALNRYYNSDLDPNMGSKNGLTYENRTGAGVVREAATGLWVNPKVPASVQLAQQIENDAATVREIASEMAQQYPELGFASIEEVKLDPALQGDVARVVAIANGRQEKPAEPVAKAEAETTIDNAPSVAPVIDNASTAEAVVAEQVEQPAKPARVVSRVTEEQAVKLSPNGLSERLGRLMDKRAEESATEEDMATYGVLDAEQTKRDLAAKPVTLMSRIKGLFSKAYVEPKQGSTTGSRIYDKSSPLQMVRNALKSTAALKAFVSSSSEIRNEITPEIAESYAGLMRNGDRRIELMNAELRKFLDKKVGPDGKTIEQHILDGTKPKNKAGNFYDILTRPNGKAANLLIEQDGKLVYDPFLLEAAVLASLQWTMAANRFWKKPDDRTMAKLLGIQEHELTHGLRNQVRAGMGAIEIKGSLARMVQEFWGLSVDNTADQALIQGIAEGISGELMNAMLQTDALTEVETIRMLDEAGKVRKEIPRYKPYVYEKNKDGTPHPIYSYPTAIEDAVLTETTPEYTIGAAPKNLGKAQMNNSRTPLTPVQERAIRKESDTGYGLNQPLANLWQSMSEDLFLDLFGTPDLQGRIDRKEINEEHAKSLKGRAQTMQSAFQSIGRLMAQLENGGDMNAKVYFAHGVSSIGRMQQLGRDTPQSSKWMREVLLPTEATLDLSNMGTSDASLYQLAMAQMLGVKVHNFLRSTTITKLNEALAEPKMAEALEIMKQWHTRNNAGKPMKITAAHVATFRKAFGGEVEAMAFHALFDYARLQVTPADDRAGFKTQLYVEADGVSNGPVNAITMATHGRFTAQWLKNVAKGGLFALVPNQTFNAHKQNDSVDLYQTAADKMGPQFEHLIRQFEGDPALHNQLENIFRLMTFFNKKNVVRESGRGVPTFDRGIAKNPMTILLYGSGARGIAANIANDLMDLVYSEMSKAAERKAADPTLTDAEAMFGQYAFPRRSAEELYTGFTRIMNELTHTEAVRDNENKLSVSPKAGSINKIVPETFVLTDKEFRALQENMLTLFVGPLEGAIEDAIGKEVKQSMEAIRDATNIQSVFLKHEFLNEIRRTLKKLGRGPGEFLSRREQEEVFQRALGRLSPFIQTGDQNFFPASTDSMTLDNLEFGRSFGDKFRTDGSFSGVELAGVGGVPMMIVGMGDGYMMQLASTMADAVPGTLKIFDGVNLPLNLAEKGSEQVNQAAFEAMMNNPLKEVAKTFRKFMDVVQVGELTEEHRTELLNALYNRKPPKDKQVTEADMRAKMEDFLQNIETKAVSVEARHNVMRRLPLTVDQMAAVGAPYTQDGDGTIDIQGLEEDAAKDVLNVEYEKEFARLQNTAAEAAPKPDASFEELLDKVSIGVAPGIRTVSHTGLKRLMVGLNIPADQKLMLREIVKSLSTKEYRVVLGSNADISAWADRMGVAKPKTLDGNLKGYMSPRDRMIFVSSGQSETLVHELIHAATYEKLLAHYGNRDLGANSKEQAEAIERIEKLYEQFERLSGTEELPYKARESYAYARSAMQEHMSKNTAAGKAAAVNEFMAWALTNENLTDVLSKTKIDHPLVALAKDVIKALKTLIWGRQAQLKVADDMLSNLQFNTAILVNSAAPASVVELLEASTLEHNEQYGTNERNTALENFFKDKVASTLKIHVDPTLPIDMREAEILRRSTGAMARDVQARMNAREVVNTFHARGFPMTPQDAGLFEMIVAALGTEAQFDANTLSEVAKLYDHVVKKLTPGMFLTVSEENATEPDRAMAQDRYDLVVGNLTNQKDLSGRSTMLSAFLALSMTNEPFRKVLSKIAPPQTELAKWNTMDGILDNVGIVGMENLGRLMSGAKRNTPDVQAAMAALQDRLTDVAAERENWAERTLTRGHSVIDRVNEIFTKGMVWGSDRLIETLDALGNRAPNSKFVSGLTASLKVLATVMNEPAANAQTIGFMNEAMKAKLYNPLFALINEIVGRTSENAGVYDLIKLVRAFVQQVRQQFREDLPKVLNSKYGREITEEEQTRLWQLARADIAALVDPSLTEEQVIDMLSNMQSMTAAIETTEAAAANATGSNWMAVQKKAKQLAKFINTGEFGPNLLPNAEAIANLLGEAGFSRATKPSIGTINAIDKLVSLYALQSLPQATKDTVSQLAQEERAGLAFTLSYLVGQRKDEQAKIQAAGGMARMNHYKGYVPSEAKGGHNLIVRKDDDVADLKMMGYVRVGDYVGSKFEPKTAGPRGYYFSPVPQRARYMQGIIQNVRPTAAGVDPLTGYTNDGASSAGVIINKNLIERIRRLTAAQGHLGAEPLRAIYNSGGEVVAYERTMSPAQSARVVRNTNLSEMIGAWRGRQVEEEVAAEFNARTLRELKIRYDADKRAGKDVDKIYVNLFDPALKDPIYRDAVAIMNKETRKRISDTFGETEFFPVRKDMIDDVIGYRSASIGDSWTGVSRWPEPMQKAFKELATAVFGPKAYQRLMQAEMLWQNFVTDARVTIVVKSVIVPMANLAANFLQLLSRGVPIHEIVKGMPRKTAEVKTYTEGRLRQIEVEAELRAVGNDISLKNKLEAELQAISDKNRYLTIWPLIQAGEFSSISDTAMSREDLLMSEGRLSDLMESLVQRLPEGIRTGGRYAIIAKDTSLFKGLQRAVEYGDFLGKAVMYDHLTKRKGMSPKEALGKITEEFVNYDRLSGRARAALEGNGLLWFWHFKLRATKIGVSMLRNNPLHAFLALSAPGVLGLEVPGSMIGDAAPMVLANPQAASFTMGLDMAFTSHLMHPTLNILT